MDVNVGADRDQQNLRMREIFADKTFFENEHQRTLVGNKLKADALSLSGRGIAFPADVSAESLRKFADSWVASVTQKAQTCSDFKENLLTMFEQSGIAFEDHSVKIEEMLEKAEARADLQCTASGGFSLKDCNPTELNTIRDEAVKLLGVEKDSEVVSAYLESRISSIADRDLKVRETSVLSEEPVLGQQINKIRSTEVSSSRDLSREGGGRFGR